MTSTEATNVQEITISATDIEFSINCAIDIGLNSNLHNTYILYNFQFCLTSKTLLDSYFVFFTFAFERSMSTVIEVAALCSRRQIQGRHTLW